MTILSSLAVEEKIKLAKNCQDESTQKALSRSYNINIRKALAKNKFLSVKIANSLAFDPSLNVSFHASNNSNCTKKRSFSPEALTNKCIVCEIDELILDCNSCQYN